MPATNKGNELNIGIGLDTKGLKKGIKEAEKDISKFGDEAKRAAKKTEELSKSADKNTKSFGKLTNSLGDVGNGLDNVTRSSGDVGDKLRGLGQISKGVSGSFATVGSGALIAAGSILAVAAAALTAGYYYGKHRAEAYDLELQYKKLNTRVKEYEKTLWGLEKTVLTGTQNAASEIASLNTLRAGIEDVNTPMKIRLDYITELKRKYPTLLKGMSDEDILAGKLGTAYFDLATNILKTAKAKALLGDLTEQLQKQFALEFKFSKETEAIQDKLNTERLRKEQETAQGVSGAWGGVDRATTEQTANEKELLKLEKDREGTIADMGTVAERMLQISNKISDNGGLFPLGVKTPKTKTKTDKPSKEILDFRKAEADYDKMISKMRGSFEFLQSSKVFSGLAAKGGAFDNTDIIKNFEGIGSSLEDQTSKWITTVDSASLGFSNMLIEVNEMANNVPEWFPLPGPDIEKISEDELIIQNYLDNITMMLDNFGVAAADLVANNIASAFTDLGRVIGESLAMGENVIGALGSSLLSSMGKFLGELGEMLIVYGTYSIMMGVLSTIAQTPGPQGIIAGAAAIGVGIAMVAISSAIGSRQAAGPSGGGSTAGVGGGGSRSSSGSSISSSGGGSSGGTYVFEIEGTKLVGVLANTLSRNRALGGSLSII